MAASPINGDRDRSSAGGFRRSSSQFASIPQRSLSFHEKVAFSKDDAAADVLFSHSNVRIYKFQPPTDALKSLDKTQKTLPDADYPIDAIEILPWRSRTEMLSAKGKLIIEKVQGSVHFLKAGDLIHTIMKNSQCWCVDGESKFVMRVGKLRYQRIEFPTAEADEKNKVKEFQEVISKILKFEKTPCPFIRAFQVDLPEDAITPRRRGTWKRRESLTPSTPDDEIDSVRKTKTSRTMSMKGMPPSSFPSRSMTQFEMDRPRTASTPSSARFSFPDVRIESPTNYTSSEDNTDSDRPDSESERLESSHNSDVEENVRDISTVPIIKSPLKNVETLPAITDNISTKDRDRASHDTAREAKTFSDTARKFKGNKLYASPSSVSGQHQAESDQVVAQEEPLPSTTVKKVLNTVPTSADSTRGAQRNMESTDGQRTSGSRQLQARELNVHLSTPTYVNGVVLDSERSTKDSDEAEEQVAASPISDGSTTGDGSLNIAPYDAQRVTKTEISPTDQIELLSGTSQQMPTPGSDSTFSELRPAFIDILSSAEPKDEGLIRTLTNEDAESVTSTDSFHTLLSDDDIGGDTLLGSSLNTRTFQHRRELSEMTVTATSMELENAVRQAPSSRHTDLPAEPVQELFSELRAPGAYTEEGEIRQRSPHHRSSSPLPPASILQPAGPSNQGSPIPAVLLQKAATLAVVKPIEIVLFVVHILARIAGGATMNDLVSGDLFRRPGARRTATGTFERAVTARSSGGDSEDEDDFGVPVHGRRKSSQTDAFDRVRRHDDDAASFASID